MIWIEKVWLIMFFSVARNNNIAHASCKHIVYSYKLHAVLWRRLLVV